MNEDMIKSHFPELEYFIPAAGSYQSDTVLFKNGETLACFTATASFPFMLKTREGCFEVRNIEEIERIIKS